MKILEIETLTDEMIFNEDFLYNFVEIKDRIHSKIFEVLEEINKIKEIKGLSCLEVKEIDTGTVYLEGEYYRCGDYETFSFDFPLRLIYSESAKKDYINKILQEQQDKLNKEDEARKQAILIQEKRDKELYLKLKDKFE